jgi:uncharacterized membrane protein
METWFLKFIDLLGASVCHQLPERSFSAGNLIIPVCARCEGIYIGFFISAVFLFLMFKHKESDLPRVYIVIILCLFIVSTVIDGGLSYLGLVKTNNIFRYLTGFLSGAGSMAIVYPVFNFQYYSDPGYVRIFNRTWQFIVFLAVNAVFILAGLAGSRVINLFFYFAAFISVIFTFYFINLVILVLIPYFSKKAPALFSKYLILPSIISLALTVAELYLSYRFHLFILRLSF